MARFITDKTHLCAKVRRQRDQFYNEQIKKIIGYCTVSVIEDESSMKAKNFSKYMTVIVMIMFKRNLKSYY